jgi:hypothetical protein
MLTREEFDRALLSVSESEERVAILGALLARATRLGRNLVILGGSAISIRTRGEYVSGDIDILGRRTRIVRVLERWGFSREEDRDGRTYWTRGDLGLAIDIIDRARYSGHSAGVQTIQTPYGPTRIAAVEDLILRRLIRWKATGRREFLDQAVPLLIENRERIDYEYLETRVRYERIEDAYQELRRLAEATSETRSSLPHGDRRGSPGGGGARSAPRTP